MQYLSIFTSVQTVLVFQARSAVPAQQVSPWAAGESHCSPGSTDQAPPSLGSQADRWRWQSPPHTDSHFSAVWWTARWVWMCPCCNPVELLLRLRWFLSLQCPGNGDPHLGSSCCVCSPTEASPRLPCLALSAVQAPWNGWLEREISSAQWLV